MTRPRLLCLWLAALLVSADITAGDNSQGEDAIVRLTVKPGERVTWVNKDLFPHTVTAAAHAFDSGSIAAGASWTYVAGKTGEYAYGCTFHPTMKGILKVQ